MSAVIQNLITSLNTYTGNVKTALDQNRNDAESDLDNAVIELTRQFEAAVDEFGEPAGGSLTVASYEAFSEVDGNVINVSLANHYRKTVSGNITFSLSNVPAAGKVVTFALHLIDGGSATVQWWPNVKWSGGTAPTLTASGRDVVAFTTLDGGATWDGYLLGKDMKAVV
jgi:hypothetical protein